MRILVVSPWLPHANILHAGGQYLYQMLRSLSARHEMHLVCYQRNETPNQIAELNHLCQSVALIKPAYTWGQKCEHLLKDGWRHPFLLGRRTHHLVQHAIRSICHEHKIDVVHFVWTEMGRYLDCVPTHIAAVLHTLDVEYVVRPREVALYTQPTQKAQARRRMKRLIAIERKAIANIDVVIAASEADKAALAVLNNQVPIVVCTPWIGFLPDRVQTSSINPGQLTFMGAMDRVANIAAAYFLVDHVWPLISNRFPHLTLKIAGANPPRALMERCQTDPRIRLTGYYDDPSTIWDETDIAVAPSLIGGGLLIKVAQPMAWGRPVVTTSFGNTGVNAQKGLSVEIGDDGNEFSAAVSRLLEDRAYWMQVATAGQQHVRETLNWQASMHNLENAYYIACERLKRRQSRVQEETTS